MTEYITTIEAGQILGVSSRWIRVMVNDGKLEGHRLGRDYLVSRASVMDYKARRDAR